jgi:PilZ domain
LQNRRKHVRLPILAQVACIAESQTMRGVTRNISESGIQVELPGLPKKANVQLTFRLLPSGTIIDVRGFVVWASGRRHGIRFNQMGNQSHESIRHFIEQRKS